ncbi:hypothetical protein [Parendozoicomonas haliclonae]|uniref:Uncharacterized protein n=1 Tax=Parendozoicomonas haliclonae TaxID=1960125 RepID=A0A1X7AMQ0_9GAMM|nr:hypothetical protein [Parendozoicomonas haliclonae]SMA49577.1 hypothetical protein EHSB41UT_03363 [Parendozoicomonas haliclonae]
MHAFSEKASVGYIAAKKNRYFRWFGSLLLVFTATTVLARPPITKSCEGDDCKNAGFTVKREGPACAHCGRPVVNHQPIRVINIQRKKVASLPLTATTSSQENTDPPISEGVGGTQVDSQTWEADFSMEASPVDLYWLLNLYMPPIEKHRKPLSPRGATYDVGKVSDAWEETLFNSTDVELMTELMFWHWDGDQERIFEKRMPLKEIEWPNYLPLLAVHEATAKASVMLDILSDDEALHSLMVEKHSALKALSHFFLNYDLARVLAARRNVLETVHWHSEKSPGMKKKMYEEMISLEQGTRIAGMDLPSVTYGDLSETTKYDSALDKLREALKAESSVETFNTSFGQGLKRLNMALHGKNTCSIEPHFSGVKAIAYASSKGVDGLENDSSEEGSEQSDNPSPMESSVPEEIPTEDSIVPTTDAVPTKDQDSSSPPEYFKDMMAWDTEKAPKMTEDNLNSILSQLQPDDVIGLEVGEVRWILRRSQNGFSLYLPGFWVSTVQTADDALTLITNLHRAMIASLEDTAKTRVNNYHTMAKMADVGDEKQKQFDEWERQRRSYTFLKQVRDKAVQVVNHPYAPVMVALVCGVAGLTLQKVSRH